MIRAIEKGKGRGVFPVPVAAVTNHHKRGDKTTHIYSLTVLEVRSCVSVSRFTRLQGQGVNRAGSILRL